MEKKKEKIQNLEQVDAILRQKLIEGADQYEEELNSDPSLDGLNPSPQVFENIMAIIAAEEAAKAAASDESSSAHPEELLSEEDRRALELGRKQMAHPVRRRVLRLVGVAAAVMIGVFGVSMVSEANRERLMHVINILVAKESVARLNNDDTNKIVNVKENDARADIQEKLGVSPIIFMYMPGDMIFDGYVVNETMGSAMMYYKYQDTIVYSTMEKREDGASDGATRDGEILETFEVNSDVGTVLISEIQGPNEKDYLAELNHKGCYYSVYGILPKEEFVKMIENLLIS